LPFDLEDHTVKLARIGLIGYERPIVEANGRYFDLSTVTSDIDGSFLESDGIRIAREAVAAGVLRPIELRAGERIGAPIARPSAVICVGMNYAAHAAESGSPPPDRPIIFLKTPNTVVGPDDIVAIPRGSSKTDWEVELGVVIGRRASYLGEPSDSAAHIAGYVTGNDLSEREAQIELSGGQWSKGKCAPGFNPLGPWLVPADELDPNSLRLRSWVNGEPRQDSSTGDMIFDVDYLVWNISQYLALEPGDLIMTGTPQGVALSGRFPYLTAGDVCEIEIEGLGRQRQAFV
jgi:2,4-diketo-3-deoxy-L-fuconate hydrolase